MVRDPPHHHHTLGWGISARGVFRIGPSMRDEAPWELEGRGRPIWDRMGSGLMGPRVSPIVWSHFGTGLGDMEAPDPALTSAEKGQHWAPEVVA